MPVNRNSRIAWGLTLAPIFLFIPAFMLAGMGPCTFSHPIVIVIAFLIFIGLELAAFPRFVQAARATGAAVRSIIGMGLALLLLVLSVALEYYFVTEYLEDMRLGLT
jgi:hypothetical protein